MPGRHSQLNTHLHTNTLSWTVNVHCGINDFNTYGVQIHLKTVCMFFGSDAKLLRCLSIALLGCIFVTLLYISIIVTGLSPSACSTYTVYPHNHDPNIAHPSVIPDRQLIEVVVTALHNLTPDAQSRFTPNILREDFNLNFWSPQVVILRSLGGSTICYIY